MTNIISKANYCSLGIQIICFLFLFSFSNSTLAQKKTNFLTARKGIAYTSSGNKFKFKSFRETENSFIFLTMNKTEVKLEKFKIAQIDKRYDTKGFRYSMTAIGGTCLVVIHSYYLGNFYNLPSSRSIHEGEILIISVALSIFTGTLSGLIGLSQKRYKTIYSSPSFGNYEPKLNIKTTSPNAIPSLTLSYTF